MKLLVFSLLLCGAWAQTQDSADPPQHDANGTEVGEGANEAFGDGVEKASGKWQFYYGRFYMFHSSLLTWGQAQQRCLAMGGTLASIHNSGQEKFVRERVAIGRESWIGLTDAQHDGHWFWANGNPLRYTNWCAGEPNNAGGPQDCAVINFSDYRCWDDQNCYMKRSFVCQKK